MKKIISHCHDFLVTQGTEPITLKQGLAMAIKVQFPEVGYNRPVRFAESLHLVLETETDNSLHSTDY